MDRVFYPTARLKQNHGTLEATGAEFAGKLKAAIVQLRGGARQQDHKLSVAGGRPVWTSDIGGRKGGRIVYLRRDGRLVVWGFSADHAAQAEADRILNADLAESLFDDLIDVTFDFLTEAEEEEARQHTRIFAGNLSDDLLRELGLSDRQLADVRKADAISLFDLANIPPSTRYKIYELSRLPIPSDFQARDDQHLLDFLRGDTDRLMIHLSPEQEEHVYKPLKKPMLIRGETGTGKTTILIYRACFHALEHPDQRLALFTFNKALASLIRESVEELNGRPLANLAIDGFYEWMKEILGKAGVPFKLIEDDRSIKWDDLAESWLDDEDRRAIGIRDPRRLAWLLRSEFDDVILDGDLKSLDEYRTIEFHPHDCPMTAERVERFWCAYERYRAWLTDGGFDTYKTLLLRFRALVARPDFPIRLDGVFVDEMQDLSPVALDAIRGLLTPGAATIVLAGDYKQSIYRKAYGWEQVRLPFEAGSMPILKNNHRNSRQILEAAHGLLTKFVPAAESPVPSKREGPEIRFHYYRDEERGHLLESLVRHFHDEQGCRYSDIGVFTPFKPASIVKRLEESGIPADQLPHAPDAPPRDAVKVTTLLSAKGLEFRVVVITGLQGQLLTDMRPGRPITLREAAKRVYVGMTRACNFLAFVLHAGEPSNPILEAVAQVLGKTTELRENGIEPVDG